jgi:hypothetical protein
MRKSLLLYLFVFAALLAIYFYASGLNLVESKEERIEKLETELSLLKSQIEAQKTTQQPASPDFSLASNEEAMTYLENRGFDPLEVIAKVQDELIKRNSADADNSLVPFKGMEGFFRINKVKLLNHKWALASFTDGSTWGDLLVSYELDDSGNLEIFSEKAVLHPRN